MAGKSEQGSTDGKAEPQAAPSTLSGPGLQEVVVRQWSSQDTSSYGSAGEGASHVLSCPIPKTSYSKLLRDLQTPLVMPSGALLRLVEKVKKGSPEGGLVCCADEDEEDDGETDDGDATRYSGAGSAATYWDALLRQHWEQLEKEEGAAQGRLGKPTAVITPAVFRFSVYAPM